MPAPWQVHPTVRSPASLQRRVSRHPSNLVSVPVPVPVSVSKALMPAVAGRRSGQLERRPQRAWSGRAPSPAVPHCRQRPLDPGYPLRRHRSVVWTRLPSLSLSLSQQTAAACVGSLQ